MTRLRNERGFTLVELVMIIVLLMILAAVAIPRAGDMAGTRASAVARKLQADIVYAQSLAMTRNLPHRIYFNVNPAPASGYAVVNDAVANGNWGADPGEIALDPANGGGTLSVTLNAGVYAGVTISAVGFAGSFVSFNTLGVPSAAGSVTVSGGATNQTVTVQPQTGRVSIP
jgi:Tfp pilus assembly protein FimT